MRGTWKFDNTRDFDTVIHQKPAVSLYIAAHDTNSLRIALHFFQAEFFFLGKDRSAASAAVCIVPWATGVHAAALPPTFPTFCTPRRTIIRSIDSYLVVSVASVMAAYNILQQSPRGITSSSHSSDNAISKVYAYVEVTSECCRPLCCTNLSFSERKTLPCWSVRMISL